MRQNHLGRRVLAHLDGVYRGSEHGVVVLDAPPVSGLGGVGQVTAVLLQDAHGLHQSAQSLQSLQEGRSFKFKAGELNSIQPPVLCKACQEILLRAAALAPRWARHEEQTYLLSAAAGRVLPQHGLRS